MARIGERDPRRNKLLQVLKPEEYARLERHLQIVAFAARQPVYEANDLTTTVYFPVSGVLALVNLLEGGETLAIATIGNEGFVGHASATALQRGGFVRNERGRIVIVNRAGLEAATCECYRAMRDQYEQVLLAAA